MPSLALACRLSAAQAPQPLPRRVRNILSKYQATALIPGAGEPILGPELVTPINLLDASKWDNTHTASVSANSWSVGSSGGPMLITTPGKTYSVSFPWSSTASGAFALYNGNNPSAPLVLQQTGSSGVLSCVFTAVSTRAYFRIAVGATVTVGVAISVREILGYNNTYSTFVSGNYVESTGQTLTPVDGAVGLVVDAAGVPGPELATSWATIPAGWSVSSGVVSKTASTLNPIIGSAGTVVAGRTYRCGFNITSQTVAGSGVSLRVGGAIGGFLSGVGPKSETITATSNDAIELIARGATGDWQGVISNISVRELPGIHALQATSQNKPALRRGLVNLQTHSTPTAGQWVLGQSGTGVIPVVTYGHSTAPNGQPATRVQLERGAGTTLSDWSQFHAPTVTVATGLVHSAALWMRTTDGVSTRNISLRDGVGNTAVQVTGQWQLFVRNATPSGFMAAGCRLRGTEGTDQTADILVANAGIFQGTVTADQILAAGGIPVTTSAPASSSVGPQYWQFDGGDDRLQLSAVPFQMADDHWVVVAATVDSLAATRILFSQRNTGNTFPVVAQVVVGTSGRVDCFWRNSDGTRASIPNTGDGSILVGNPFIVTAQKIGATVRVKRDGGSWASQPAPTTGTFPINNAAIGASAENGSLPHNGAIHAVFFGKGAISDSELLTLERFAAKLQGRNL